jgi:CubicO group peptidase (beta-lactamase class C family)
MGRFGLATHVATLSAEAFRRISRVESTMFGRRAFLQAVAAGELAWFSGSSFGQTRGNAKRRAAPVGGNVQGDQRVKDVLAPVRDAHHLPGLIGAILTGGRLAAIGALGIRKIGSPEPIRITDQFHLGSDTKAMTATVIGMLVDAGKLSWASKVRDVFPDVAPDFHPAFRTVTLSHLLTHRAGLPHDGPWWDLPGQTTTEQRWSLLCTQLANPPAHKPGSTYAYSNVGYALAGLMAETVTGQPWERLMRERLFGPLEMESAGFGPPATQASVDQPWGHHLEGKDIVPTLEDNAPATGPAGTVHCSVPDWAKFAALHLGGERGRARLLKPVTFRTLHTPPPGFDYAGGWMVGDRSWANGRVLNHSGSNLSFFATIWLAPERDIAILVATNQGDQSAETACDQAVASLVRAFDFLTGQ